MRRTFARPQQMGIFRQQYLKELYSLGYNSLFIVILMSFFIGALLCVQIKINIWSPWMPRFTIGYAMRGAILLEFASSIICIILAGKVGSNIASEMEAMGIELMLAGNMGMGALNKLTSHNIRVVRGCKGDIEAVVEGYIHGFVMDSGVSCDHHECHSK